jgi:exonuclease SbcC
VITRIELKNFMSHEHTVIEPARGLTVIAGPNNCGKSAIVTALQILCYNDESTFVTRHGEKECSIKVHTDDGHEIEWIRTKNKSTKYIIDGQQHDRLGRGGTPDDLHKYLRIQKVSCDNQEFDVHFGSQQSPVFLLNDSPRAAAQFFASSSDAINLIGMQTRHKQKVRDRNQERRRLVVELETLEENLERLEAVPKLSKTLSALEAEYEQLCSAEEELVALHHLVRAIEEKRTEVERLGAQNTALVKLESPPELKSTEQLDELIVRTKRNQKQFAAMTAFTGLLKKLPEPVAVAETSEFESVLKRLAQFRKSYANASSATTILEAIEAVPELAATEDFGQLIDDLKESTRRCQLAEWQSLACKELAEPPELVSVGGLSDALSDLAVQRKELEKHERAILAASEGLSKLQLEMSSWVKANPSCPTCGSEVNADQLLRGGHRHD